MPGDQNNIDSVEKLEKELTKAKKDISFLNKIIRAVRENEHSSVEQSKLEEMEEMFE